MTDSPLSEPRPGLLIHLLDGRWTLAVIGQLSGEGRRYQDLHGALDGISYKVLTETLRRAERDGLIARRVDSKRVETATVYQLTDLGRTLEEPLEALARWVSQNWLRVDKARHEWSQRAN